MTELIQYHPKTRDLALFLGEDGYWIGSYFQQATHQNGEPPYYIISGYFSSEDTARGVLTAMTGNEF